MPRGHYNTTVKRHGTTPPRRVGSITLLLRIMHRVIVLLSYKLTTALLPLFTHPRAQAPTRCVYAFNECNGFHVWCMTEIPIVPTWCSSPNLLVFKGTSFFPRVVFPFHPSLWLSRAPLGFQKDASSSANNFTLPVECERLRKVSYNSKFK